MGEDREGCKDRAGVRQRPLSQRTPGSPASCMTAQGHKRKYSKRAHRVRFTPESGSKSRHRFMSALGPKETSRPLPRAPATSVVFIREQPAGRAEVLCHLMAAPVPSGGRAFAQSIDICFAESIAPHLNVREPLLGGTAMKLPRRKFLHLAAGAAVVGCPSRSREGILRRIGLASLPQPHVVGRCDRFTERGTLPFSRRVSRP